MKLIILTFFLIAIAFSTLTLPSIDDSFLNPLLKGDWRSLLPDDIQATKTQLLKLLAPSTAQPQHALGTHRHYRLLRADNDF